MQYIIKSLIHFLHCPCEISQVGTFEDQEKSSSPVNYIVFSGHLIGTMKEDLGFSCLKQIYKLISLQLIV